MDQIVSADPAPVTPTTSAPIVEAPLTFIRRQDEKPVFHSAALTGGAVKMFFEIEDHTVPIGAMRAIADELSLDREGFELLRHPTAVEDLHDDEAVEAVYYPEIEALLRERLGADRVVVFDATRRADSEAGAKNPDGLRGPAARVHVDYTVASGPQRVSDILGGDEAARLKASGARVVQINVWRPIHGPVGARP